MKHVQPMQNTKSKLVLNERQLELHELHIEKRVEKDKRKKSRELKRYELPDNY